jgi:hypothetical protein
MLRLFLPMLAIVCSCGPMVPGGEGGAPPEPDAGVAPACPDPKPACISTWPGYAPTGDACSRDADCNRWGPCEQYHCTDGHCTDGHVSNNQICGESGETLYRCSIDGACCAELPPIGP